MRKMGIILLLCVAMMAGCGDDDDSSDNNTNQNSSTRCGDGVLDVGEECDKGSANSDSLADACRTDCRRSACGDGVVDTGESCDDGNDSNADGCLTACQGSGDCCIPNVCGDGHVNRVSNGDGGQVEACDDGNREDGDDCRGDCGQDMTLCGNLIVDQGEACDDGPANADDVANRCRTNCQQPWCGDGVTDTDFLEECDDASNNSDTLPDACREDCLPPECGDGVIDPGNLEVCDDGPANSDSTPDACREDCALPECGDGVADPAYNEVCDLGPANSNAPDAACRPGCHPVRCGDGVVDPSNSEVCDEGAGNSNDPDADCRPDCQPRRCGDGIVDTLAGETCDDGAQVGGDGCAADCEVEPDYWACSGSPSVCTCVVYVDPDPGISTRSGRTWATAHATIQDAIAEAVPLTHLRSATCEVWVVQGTYHVYESSTADTLTMQTDVPLVGGFAGTESSKDQRDWAAHETILSAWDAGQVNQVEHVVTVSGVTNTGLDGFTITGAAPDGFARGGGVVYDNATSHLRNCLLAENTANDGGGLSLTDSTVTVANSQFRANSSDDTSGDGGAVYVNAGSSITVTGSLFFGNMVAEHGGAVYLLGQGTFTDCIFLANEAFDNGRGDGGAIWVNGGDLTLVDSLLIGNVANYTGGGIALDTSGQATVRGCVLAGNVTDQGDGGGIYSSGSVEVTNCIFTGNDPDYGGATLRAYSGTAVITNSTFAYNKESSSTSREVNLSSQATGSITNTILWRSVSSNQCALYNLASVSVTHSAVACDQMVAGTGNIDTNPQFRGDPASPLDSGTWSFVSYDPDLLQTTLIVASDPWTPGALVGAFVRPDTDADRWYPIIDNDTDRVVIWGDAEQLLFDVGGFGPGSDFEIYDLHLTTGSPCIDTADDSATYRPSVDYAGVPWADVAGVGNAGTVTDMGALEYVP